MAVRFLRYTQSRFHIRNILGRDIPRREDPFVPSRNS